MAFALNISLKELFKQTCLGKYYELESLKITSLNFISNLK
jgi:hypothetical protein